MNFVKQRIAEVCKACCGEHCPHTCNNRHAKEKKKKKKEKKQQKDKKVQPEHPETTESRLLYEGGMEKWHCANFKKLNQAEGRSMVEKAASAGFLLAQADCYLVGFNGKKQDNKKAFDMCLKIERETGYHWAQYMLGECYDYGLGTDQDDTKAFEWYTKAEKQGNTIAMSNLGVFYEDGRGCDISEKKAFDLYVKASDLGYAGAMYFQGLCYKEGTIVDKDLNKYKELLTQAAAQRYKKAINALNELNECTKKMAKTIKKTAKKKTTKAPAKKTSAKKISVNTAKNSSDKTDEDLVAIEYEDIKLYEGSDKQKIESFEAWYEDNVTHGTDAQCKAQGNAMEQCRPALKAMQKLYWLYCKKHKLPRLQQRSKPKSFKDKLQDKGHDATTKKGKTGAGQRKVDAGTKTRCDGDQYVSNVLGIKGYSFGYIKKASPKKK
jgi:TPR repeat protein